MNRASKDILSRFVYFLFAWQKYIVIPQVFFKYWDLFLMAVMLTEVLLLSMVISFEEFMTQDRFDQIQIGLLSVLGLDILLCFQKGFSEKGRIQTDPRACLWNYFFGNFFLDLVNFLSYFAAYQFEYQYLYPIYILYLAKKFYRYKDQVIDALQLSEKFGYEQIKLLELVFTTFFFAHLFGCVWYQIGEYSELNPQITPSSYTGLTSWIEAYSLKNMPWESKYVASIFWVFTTMTTIGFGDIVPQSILERLVAIVIMILSVFIFAYTVNSIGSLLSSINEKQSNHLQRLKTINQYMNGKKISDALQSKIRCYLDYIYKEEEEKVNQIDDASVLQILNKNLTNELFVEVNLKVLSKMKIFSHRQILYSDEFLREVSLMVKEKTFMPDDVISEETSSSKIYFIVKGEVKLQVNQTTHQRGPSTISVLKPGQSFGQYQFVTQEKSTYFVVPTCVTVMNFLRFSDFYKILESFPADKERFCMQREQLILEQNFDELKLNCSLCTWGNHQELKCPLISYRPQRNLVLAKFNHSIPVNRNSFNRKGTRKPNSYAILSVVYEQAIDFQEEKLQDCHNINTETYDRLQYQGAQGYDSTQNPDAFGQGRETSLNVLPESPINFVQQNLYDQQTPQIQYLFQGDQNSQQQGQPQIVQKRERFQRQSTRKLSSKYEDYSKRIDEVINEEQEYDAKYSSQAQSLTYIQDEEETNKNKGIFTSQKRKTYLAKPRTQQSSNEYSMMTQSTPSYANNTQSSGGIKGDAIELDKLKRFHFYRPKSNYNIVLDYYNSLKQTHRNLLLSSVDTRKQKKRSHQKLILFNRTFRRNSVSTNNNPMFTQNLPI